MGCLVMMNDELIQFEVGYDKGRGVRQERDLISRELRYRWTEPSITLPHKV